MSTAALPQTVFWCLDVAFHTSRTNIRGTLRSCRIILASSKMHRLWIDRLQQSLWSTGASFAATGVENISCFKLAEIVTRINFNLLDLDRGRAQHQGPTGSDPINRNLCHEILFAPRRTLRDTSAFKWSSAAHWRLNQRHSVYVILAMASISLIVSERTCHQFITGKGKN